MVRIELTESEARSFVAYIDRYKRGVFPDSIWLIYDKCKEFLESEKNV